MQTTMPYTSSCHSGSFASGGRRGVPDDTIIRIPPVSPTGYLSTGDGRGGAVDERYVTLGGGVPSSVTKRYRGVGRGGGGGGGGGGEGGVSSFPEKSVT